MFMLIDERGSGKTKKLIEFARDNNAIIICKSPYSIEEKAKAYGIMEPVKTLSYINYDLNLDPSKTYVVDDIDEFVKFKIPNMIGFTLSKD